MTEKQIQARRKRNAAFAKLSPEEKRVAIAKDVIKALGTKKIKASNGIYFSALGRGKKEFDAKKTKPSEQLDLVLKKVPKCEVCALGATFVCAVNLADKIKAKDFLKEEKEYKYDQDMYVRATRLDIDSSNMRHYLGDFFDLNQLYMIENAFERSVINLTENYYDQSVSFCTSDNPKTRMLQIMRNIVKNNGTFVP